MTGLPFIDGERLNSLVSWSAAIAALHGALGDAVAGVPRTSVTTATGQLLLMPAETASGVGVKVTAVAPGNPAAGLPRVQAVYVLFDAATLSPRALLDGTALTTMRTGALSALVARSLAIEEATRLVVFGTGPQAWGHVHALRTVRPVNEVLVIGRDPQRAAAFVRRLRSDGVTAGIGAVDDVPDADIVACATTAREPLFDGQLLADHAFVVAIGSHEPDARELDDVVFRRAARVVVEERATALREAGDLIQAIAAGALDAGRLTPVSDLPTLGVVEGISVFKGVGMGWEDLAVAEAAFAACCERDAWSPTIN